MGHNDSSRIYELGKKLNTIEAALGNKLDTIEAAQKRMHDTVYYVSRKIQELEHEALRRILFHVEALTEEEKNGKPLQRVMDQSLEAIEAIEAFVKAKPDCQEDPRLRLALGKVASVYAVAFRYVNEMGELEYNQAARRAIAEACKDD